MRRCASCMQFHLFQYIFHRQWELQASSAVPGNKRHPKKQNPPDFSHRMSPADKLGIFNTQSHGCTYSQAFLLGYLPQQYYFAFWNSIVPLSILPHREDPLMLFSLGTDPAVVLCLLPTPFPHRKNVGIEIRQTCLTLWLRGQVLLNGSCLGES